jgi:hypothetical protein
MKFVLNSPIRILYDSIFSRIELDLKKRLSQS